MKIYKTTTQPHLKKKSTMVIPKEQKTRFIGIDQSLSCTGVVLADLRLRIKMSYCIPTNSKNLPEARIDWIGMEISNLLRMHGKDLYFVAIEMPAFAACGLRDVLHGVYWEIRRRCWVYNNELDIKIVPIGTWKKHVADHGRATKPQIKQKIKEKYALTFDDENIYDAYGILRCAYDKWLVSPFVRKSRKKEKRIK